MRGIRITQVAAVAAAVVISAIALLNRSNFGMKGMPVPADSIVLCVLAAAVAAYVTARCWHWLPAPFIAGIVGVVVDGRLGPSGGVVGLLIGVAVAVVVVAESRVIRQCS